MVADRTATIETRLRRHSKAARHRGKELADDAFSG
jgi:hypothetical protein